jgi:PadR family transcriptional regulator PadR
VARLAPPAPPEPDSKGLVTQGYMSRVIVMTRSRTPSAQTTSVLSALAADPPRWRYGYDLAADVHLKSGSLYPILMRLADRGLLESDWEPGPPGKPPRHIYRLTARGLQESARLRPDPVRRRPSVLRQQLGPA